MVAGGGGEVGRAVLWERGRGNVVQTWRLFDCPDTPQSRPDTRARVYAPSSSPACQGGTSADCQRDVARAVLVYTVQRSACAGLRRLKTAGNRGYQAYRSTTAMMMSMDIPLWATSNTLTGGLAEVSWAVGGGSAWLLEECWVEMFRLHLAQGNPGCLSACILAGDAVDHLSRP